MTNSEAINEIVKETCSGCMGSDTNESHRCNKCGYNMAISALEENDNLKQSIIQQNNRNESIFEDYSKELVLNLDLRAENDKLKAEIEQLKSELEHSVNASDFVNRISKEMFSAECYNDEFNGQEVNNLLYLGNIADILEDMSKWRR